MTEQQVLCSINPNLIASDEAIGTSNNLQKILVIGAGPAGLEFARVAKLRGHKVEVIEKESSIGGALKYAKVAPMKKEVQNLIKYYEYIIKELQIDVRLDTPFTEGILKQFDPDTVVLATGISPKLPDIEGIKDSVFRHYSEILGGNLPKGQKIVILGGDMVGLELAEFLSCANKDVTILTEKKRLATDVYSLVAREIIPTIEEDDKIELMLGTTVLEIKDNKIIAVQNDRQIEIDFDELALTSVQPTLEIEKTVKDNAKRVFKIGDCKEVYPRKILDSTQEGYELGLIIETEEADILYADETDVKDGDLKSLMKIKIKRRTFTNDDIPSYLDLLAQICNANAKIQKKNKKSNLQYQISIGEDTHYFIRIEHGVFSTGEGKLDNPDITIGMDPSIAGGVFAGTVNTASAYMAKELTFEGSMMLGLKFRTITEAVAKEIEDA
jgi:thioredoxin reductase/putative sterol carrier protein